jgi:hypothetical protein
VVQLGADGTGILPVSAIDNGSNDSCGIASLVLDQTEFDCNDVGNTITVTLTVTDVSGNVDSCSATVTVEDNVAPDLDAQDITVELDANGDYVLDQDDIDVINALSSDACGIDTVSVSPDTFDCSNVGANTVTLTVTDINGNVSTNVAEVTVEDTVNPMAVCQDITIQLDALGTASITGEDVDAGSIANCGSISYTVSPSIFTCNEEGENLVTLTVTDSSGNTDTCTAIVTVVGDFSNVSISESELPEFCQGAAVVLTANNASAISYEWVNTVSPEIVIGTDQDLQVFNNGIYGVTVISATNCSIAYAEYTVSGFDLGGLISAYTILATEEVYLHGSNLVQTGGVGAMHPTIGNIKLHQASTIVGFGQAVSFDLNQGSTIGTQVNAPSNPTIPGFVFNTYSNNSSPSVTINNSQTQTLNGSVYDVVTVRQNATVNFSQSNVYINELKTFEGASIEFVGCANVYINEKFMLAQNGTINNDDPNNVVFYVNDDVQIEKGSNVRARIHTNNNDILAKGENGNGNNMGEPTYMTGLFIAKRVHGNKNVVWNADTLCEPCPIAAPATTLPDSNQQVSNELKIDLEISAYPNPSDTQFNLRLKTAVSTEKASVEVFDMSNKLVHTGAFEYDDIYTFGKTFEGGVYIVKVTQSGKTKAVRLIKY